MIKIIITKLLTIVSSKHWTHDSGSHRSGWIERSTAQATSGKKKFMKPCCLMMHKRVSLAHIFFVISSSLCNVRLTHNLHDWLMITKKVQLFLGDICGTLNHNKLNFNNLKFKNPMFSSLPNQYSCQQR